MIRIPPSGGPWAFRLGYLAVLCFATLVPFGFDPDLAAAAHRLSRGLSPALDASDYVDAVRNVFLFAGWGLLWILTSPKRGAVPLVMGAALSGAAISLGLEGLQAFSEVRHTNVLDVLTNSSGAILGAGGAVLLTRTMRRRRNRRSYLGLPALLLFTGYGLAVLVETAFPVLRTDLLPIWGGPVNRLLGALQAFDPGSISVLPWHEGALLVPAGVISVAVLVEETGKGYVRSAVLTSLWGALILAAVEVAHGAASYPVQLGPLAVHVGGLTLGAVLATCVIPPATRRFRGSQRLLWLAILYSAVVLLWVLRPFDVTFHLGTTVDQLDPGRFIPLSSHSIRADLYSVADVVQLFALHLPLGGLLAVWPVRSRGPLRGPLPAIYLAAAGEVGQILLVTRFFDVTDILVGAAGAAVGWTVVNRAGFGVRGHLLPGGEGD